MMVLNGQTGRVGADVPQHVMAIVEEKRLALAARVAAQEEAKAAQPPFSPVTVGTSKRQIRRRNWARKG